MDNLWFSVSYDHNKGKIWVPFFPSFFKSLKGYKSVDLYGIGLKFGFRLNWGL